MKKNRKHRFGAYLLTLALCLTMITSGLYAVLADEAGEPAPEPAPAPVEVHEHTPGGAVRENEVAATESSEGHYDEAVYCTGCGAELSRTTKSIPKLEPVVQDPAPVEAPPAEEAPSEPAPAEDVPGEPAPAEDVPGEPAPVEDASDVHVPASDVSSDAGEIPLGENGVTGDGQPANGNATVTYDITWLNDDGSVIASTTVEEGQVPAYAGETPVKPNPVEQHTYTFTGWNPEPAEATGNASYTAVYSDAKNSYTVTWKNDDGSVIDSAPVEFDVVPTHEDAAKAPTEDTAFTFTGWTPEPEAVAADREYVATYTASQRLYTVRFVNEAGEELSSAGYAYNTPAEGIVQPDAPAKASDGTYNYTFVNWVTADESQLPIAAVTADVTYKPVYSAALILKITSFKELSPSSLSMTYKPAIAEVVAKMPTTVGVNLNDTTITDATAALTAWSCADYDSKAEGDFAFTATLAEGGYPLADGVESPTFTFAFHVGPATAPDGSCTYRLNPAGELTIVRWNTVPEGGTVSVPAKIDDHPVVSVGAGAFQNMAAQSQTPMLQLVLPAGVKNIGDSAFADNAALTTLILPDSLEAPEGQALPGQNLIANDPALTRLILRTDLNSRLTAANIVVHDVTVEGQEAPKTVTVQMPMAVTDIIVNSNALSVECGFAVAAANSITVNAGAALTVTAGNTLTNFGVVTVNEGGALNTAGTVISCAGAWVGTTPVLQEGGVYTAEHQYENGKCKICNAEDPDYVIQLKASYTGTALTKVYDKTRNVTLKASDFKLSGIQEGDSVEISAIKASYDKADVGDRTVSVSFTLKGENAGRYKIKDLSISAKITPKELIITPTEGQKKTYGANDPTYLTGKVKGLLSGDTVTGRLARETGENVGKYKIIQGTIDAGDNYEVEVQEGYFTIDAKSINSSDVGLVTIGNQRYTGQAITPDVTLRFGTRTLTQGTDFKVEYKNNIQPGTATVKLTGAGNYTGERETTFRILNTSGGGGSSSGGSSSGGSSSGGSSSGGSSYSDDSFEGEDDSSEDGEGPEEDPDAGKLFIKDDATGQEIDYGRVLFTTDNKGASFVQFMEETQPGQWTLTIIADPMEDQQTSETLYLSGEDNREKFDELHLRIPMTLVRTLLEQGVTQIIYEFEKADLCIPLAALVDEIPLEPVPTADEEVEIEDEGEIAEVEQEIAPEVMKVAVYDFCIEQIENLTMTQRETDLLDGYNSVTPTYRLRVNVITEDDQAVIDAMPEAMTVDDGAPETLPEARELPEHYHIDDLALLVLPLDDAEVSVSADEQATDEALLAAAPEDAVAMYMSYVPPVIQEDGSQVEAEPQTTPKRDVVEQNPASFTVVDGMLYAKLLPQADGIYAVGIPAEESDEDGDGEVEFEDFSFGTGSFGNLSGIGSSFRVDENGNPIEE